MINRINTELKEAMKNKEQFRLDVLRMLKSKILVVNARGEVSDDEVVKIFRKYAKSLQESLDQQKQYNRLEEAANTEKELAIVAEFLPPEMSDADLEAFVKAAIAETGAKSVKDMGAVMKAITGMLTLEQKSSLDGGKVKNVMLQFFQ